MIKIDKEKFKELLLCKYTTKDLAEYFNCGKSTIEDRKKRWDLVKKIHRNVSIVEKDLENYIDKGYSNKKISEIYNCDVKTITNYKNKYNMSRKPIVIDNNIFIKMVKSGSTNEELAKYFNCSISPIKAKKFELKIESPNNKKGSPTHINNPTDGYYGSMTKEQADALDYPIYVYIVKLQYLDEIFYKIGITKNSNRSRYKNYSPYKVLEELTFDEYDAWDAIQEEKELHEFFSDKSYLPKTKFGGWTECFKHE